MADYRFGYCEYQWTIRFPGGQIDPLAESDETRQWISKYQHRDGFIYPPIVEQGDESGNRHPNTERPAHLFRLPASHALSLANISAADGARENASFVIHLLGYLFGGWYQFADWWFDARVPLKSTHHICAHPKVAEHFLTHGWETSQTWSSEAKRRFTNILFVLNRAPAYEWDWEHFVTEYMVLDGCYRMARDLKLMTGPEPSHAERISAMCDAFNIQRKDDLGKEIVRLRNQLFHETLWANGRPGTAREMSAFFAPLHLRRLNQKLIPALLSYRTPYIQTSWWTLGNSAFDIPPA